MSTLTHDERLVLIGLITDPVFTAKAIPILQEQHFTVAFTRAVFRWCRDYIQEIGRPPGRTIQEIHAGHRQAETESEELLDVSGTFLASISKELDESTEKIDTDYLLSRMSIFVKARDLSELQKSLDIAIKNDELEDAEEAVAAFSSVRISDIEHIDFCAAPEKALSVLREGMERTLDGGLFQFPGDLATLFGPFQRGDLIAFAAPGKRGKTWWLQECAILAARAGNRVVLFSLEMSAGQIVGRISRRMARRPGHPMRVTIPYFDEGGFILTKEQQFDDCLRSFSDEKILSLYGKLVANGGGLITQAYPAYTAGVGDLQSFLNFLESGSGYKADVIIVDYADILKSEYRGEHRHQLDHVWKMLRSLAQERDALVITATHTNKKTYTKNIGQADMAEESRKLHHVAAMIGLNQTDGEKTAGIMRASVLASRHDNFSLDEEVVILQCLDLAQPCLDSRFKNQVPNYEEIKNGGQFNDG